MTAQLALRDFVGKQKLDDILANKDELSRYAFERLKAKENEFFVETIDAGVKDIILPGRDPRHHEYSADRGKAAQGQRYHPLEEVASTRSLLNTAKLMEENPTLYRLKELEHIERICDECGQQHQLKRKRRRSLSAYGA